MFRYYLQLTKTSVGFYKQFNKKPIVDDCIVIGGERYYIDNIKEYNDWETNEITFEIKTITIKEYRDKKLNTILNDNQN